MQIINPKNGVMLENCCSYYSDNFGNKFPIVEGVLRIAESDNYTEYFGILWNKFDKTQLDSHKAGKDVSRLGFFAQPNWHKQDISGKNLLEVGSGAGFSKVIPENTNYNSFSIDYSDSVTANYNDNAQIVPDRFHLFQASIYELPFMNESFDKFFYMGILQHTPDFSVSIKALIDKVIPGGVIMVDFYPIKGWWSKLHAKYLLRFFIKRLRHAQLMRIIKSNIYWLIYVQNFFHVLGLGILTRFLPIVDIQRTFPKYLSVAKKREWAVFDTFDMFLPSFDNPQRIEDVVSMFTLYGAEVSFSGFVHFDCSSAAVVRGIKHL